MWDRSSRYRRGTLADLDHLVRGLQCIKLFRSMAISMSNMFLKSVWLQNSVRARALVEKKACVVGLTRLLCESELCLSNPALWAEVLVANVKVLEENAEGAVAVKDEDETLLELEQTGYEAGYSKLYFASSTLVDYLPEFPAPTRYLAESIAKLSAARPGVVCSVLLIFLLLSIVSLRYHCCSILRTLGETWTLPRRSRLCSHTSSRTTCPTSKHARKTQSSVGVTADCSVSFEHMDRTESATSNELTRLFTGSSLQESVVV